MRKNVWKKSLPVYNFLDWSMMLLYNKYSDVGVFPDRNRMSLVPKDFGHLVAASILREV